jgi:putative membrane protein
MVDAIARIELRRLPNANEKNVNRAIRAPLANGEVAIASLTGGVMNGAGPSIKVALSMAVVSSVLLQSQSAYAQQRGGFGSWGMGSGMAGGYGMGLFGSIFMIAFWALILVGAFFLVKWLVKGPRGHMGDARPGSSALEILEERYARGEIDREEFEQKKRDLRGG